MARPALPVVEPADEVDEVDEEGPADVDDDEATVEVAEEQPNPGVHVDHEIVEIDHDSEDIVDEVDRCPDAPEDNEGFEDIDGCPDPDPDQGPR